MEVQLDKTLFELLLDDRTGKVLAALIAEWQELAAQIDAQRPDIVAAGRDLDWLRAQHAMHVAREVIDRSESLRRV